MCVPALLDEAFPAVAYLQAIILGVVQGLAEFLPISSSGHIVIVDELLATYGGGTMPKTGLAMNVALHVGTLFSIALVCRRELLAAARDYRMWAAVTVATLPLVLLFPFKDTLEAAFESALVAGCGLLVTATLLLISERLGRDDGATEVGVGQAGLIGLFQMIAPCPGISRSGSTIAGGLIAGVERKTAATFSFVIALPAIGGGAAASLLDLAKGEGGSGLEPGPVAVGMLVSFAVGVAALRAMLRIVTRKRLWIFAIYCAVVGTTTIAWRLSAG